MVILQSVRRHMRPVLYVTVGYRIHFKHDPECTPRFIRISIMDVKINNFILDGSNKKKQRLLVSEMKNGNFPSDAWDPFNKVHTVFSSFYKPVKSSFFAISTPKHNNIDIEIRWLIPSSKMKLVRHIDEGLNPLILAENRFWRRMTLLEWPNLYQNMISNRFWILFRSE